MQCVLCIFSSSEAKTTWVPSLPINACFLSLTTEAIFQEHYSRKKFFCRCIWTFPFTLGSPGSDVPAMAGSTAHPRASEKGARLSQRNTPFKTHLEAASNKSSWHCCLGDLPQRNSYFYFEVHYRVHSLSEKYNEIQFLFYSLKIPFHCEGNAALFPFDEMSCTAKLESRKYPFHSFNLLCLKLYEFFLPWKV